MSQCGFTSQGGFKTTDHPLSGLGIPEGPYQWLNMDPSYIFYTMSIHRGNMSLEVSLSDEI